LIRPNRLGAACQAQQRLLRPGDGRRRRLGVVRDVV